MRRLHGVTTWVHLHAVIRGRVLRGMLRCRSAGSTGTKRGRKRLGGGIEGERFGVGVELARFLNLFLFFLLLVVLVLLGGGFFGTLFFFVSLGSSVRGRFLFGGFVLLGGKRFFCVCELAALCFSFRFFGGSWFLLLGGGWALRFWFRFGIVRALLLLGSDRWFGRFVGRCSLLFVRLLGGRWRCQSGAGAGVGVGVAALRKSRWRRLGLGGVRLGGCRGIIHGHLGRSRGRGRGGGGRFRGCLGGCGRFGLLVPGCSRFLLDNRDTLFVPLFSVLGQDSRIQILLVEIRLDLKATLLGHVNVGGCRVFNLPRDSLRLRPLLGIDLRGVQLRRVNVFVIGGLDAKHLLVDRELVPLFDGSRHVAAHGRGRLLVVVQRALALARQRRGAGVGGHARASASAETSLVPIVVVVVVVVVATVGIETEIDIDIPGTRRPGGSGGHQLLGPATRLSGNLRVGGKGRPTQSHSVGLGSTIDAPGRGEARRNVLGVEADHLGGRNDQGDPVLQLGSGFGLLSNENLLEAEFVSQVRWEAGKRGKSVENSLHNGSVGLLQDDPLANEGEAQVQEAIAVLHAHRGRHGRRR
mmetsp:Transcript_33035/g.78059  ORF Transcript_33035/g.78059 Transcript_33035/m.78059 type:complete len:582 (+) Transcript_33035:2236-3981(+)